MAKTKTAKKTTTNLTISDKYYFDEEEAERAVRFFEKKLVYGGTQGLKPFKPMDFEKERIIKPFFGTKKKDNGLRRYNKIFLYVPRKNNKTTLGVGMLQCCFFLDNEPSAQVYNAANDEQQARLSFDLAKYMIENNESLKGATTLRLPSIHRHKTNAIWKPLSKESKNKDGFNIHAACCDELHEWINRDLYDKIKTGFISRPQPLLMITTTAGTYDPTALWMEVYNYCKKIKKGEIIDDSWLVVMYEPEDDEINDPHFDPFNEDLWKRVNPGWGQSVNVERFKEQAVEARNNPLFLNVFKRYHLNITTKSVDVFIPHHIWDAGAGDRKERPIEFYKGRKCFIGVDLASYEDLVAMALVFPNDDKTIDIKMYYWVTYDKAIDRKTKNEADYFTWRDLGYIEIVPGNRHDYGLILNKLYEINKLGIEIPVVGYDEWNAHQFAQDVTVAGINCNGWPPRNKKLWHKPTQNLHSLATANKINHYGNQVLSWNVENIAISYDGEYIRPDKAKSRDKIDGAMAAVIAIGEWMNYQEKPEDTGIYIG